MTQTDLAQMSKDDLIDLVLAQTQQVAKLQAEIEALRLRQDKGRMLPIISQSPSNDMHRLPQLQPDPIINIKPTWRTTNRLQNCHKPKSK